MRWILVVGVACLCLALSRSVIGTLSKDDKKKPGSKEPQVQHLCIAIMCNGGIVQEVLATAKCVPHNAGMAAE